MEKFTQFRFPLAYIIISNQTCTNTKGVWTMTMVAWSTNIALQYQYDFITDHIQDINKE
jgi:hypothetical protein